MLARTKRRIQLVWRCLDAVNRSMEPDPQAGQFKLAYPVHVKAAGKQKLHGYMLKRGASPDEVDKYSDSGYSSHHRETRGDGQLDLLREVEAQELGTVEARLVARYVAWGWVNGVFYAVQPMLSLHQPDQLFDGLDGVDWDDPPYPHLDLLANLPDCDPIDWHNCGVYHGRIKCYDWGYGMPIGLSTPGFRATYTRYAKAA